MHDDGVDRILDLVAYAGSEAPDSREPAGKFELIFDGADRLEVVEREQGAEILVFAPDHILDQLERDRDPAAAFGLQLFILDRNPFFESFFEEAAQWRPAIEYVEGGLDKDMLSIYAQKAVDRA